MSINNKDYTQLFLKLINIINDDENYNFDIFFDYHPVIDFENKSDYPYDYLLFMEEIGQLEVISDGEKILMFDIAVSNEELNYGELNINFSENLNNLHIDLNPEYKIFGSRVDGEIFIFNTSYKPYEVLAISEENEKEYKSFTNFFASIFLDLLNEFAYLEDLDMNHDVRVAFDNSFRQLKSLA